MHRLAAAILVLLAVVMCRQTSAAGESWLTRSGYYRISYRSELSPIVINRIHAWIIHVESVDGEPVNGATISVTGGMPLHNHGLPTAPQMTAALGNGDYRLDGLRFHMSGDWQLTVTIVAAGGRRTDHGIHDDNGVGRWVDRKRRLRIAGYGDQ